MGLIELLILILVIMWLGGFTLHVAGSLIHFLLVVAVLLFIVRCLRDGGGRTL